MMMLHHCSKDHPITGYFISSEQVDEGGVGGEEGVDGVLKETS